MAKTVVITQSNYLPWRGFFDLLGSAEEVILLDCVQFTRRDWRNRNLIKTPNGTAWLTVPVVVKGRYLQAIDETLVVDPTWAARHEQLIHANYRRATCYEEVAPWFYFQLQEAAKLDHISEINAKLLRSVCRFLGIKTVIRQSSDVLDRAELIDMERTDRLLNLCLSTQADRYLSAPAAQAYLDRDRFAEAGIEVAWMNYDGYADYPQQWGSFVPKVSVIDLILNTGCQAHGFVGRASLTGDASLQV